MSNIKKRILIVNKFLYYKGGAETYAIKVGETLKKRGYEVEYFGMYSAKNVVGNELNIYTSEMDFHTKSLKKILYPFSIIYSIDAKRKIRKIIEKFKPDIIHLNNINFQLTPSIIEEANRKKIPVVQTVHDYQMICPNHLLYNKNGICEKCIKGSKWNCTKYNCIHDSKVKSIIGSLEAILYTKILKTYKKVNKYICPSNFIEKQLLKQKDYMGKTKTLHNFIELTDIDFSCPKDDYVLFFGRLSEEKGLRIFIETCRELNNIKFKIAGVGPLESLTRNIDNVEYVGFKTGQDLEELIQKAKFTVYPSVWYENCPLSILESESLGTPVITANYGGMKELVKNNITGLLIDVVNKANLKKAITDLYYDNDKINKMSKNCIEERKNMITLDCYIDEIEKIYNEVLGEKYESSDDRT